MGCDPLSLHGPFAASHQRPAALPATSSPGITICLNLQLHLRKQPPLMLFSQIKSYHLLSSAPIALTAQQWLATVPLEAHPFVWFVVAGAVLLEPAGSCQCLHGVVLIWFVLAWKILVN